MKNLLHFTINFKNPAINLIALAKSCAKIACCSSDFIFTFSCEGNNIQNAC